MRDVPDNMNTDSIQKIFSEVPRTYELVNHVLTLGLDTLWRKKAAKHAAQTGGTRWLDVCSGTGDMALLLRRAACEGTTVISLDVCLPMLRKAAAKPEAKTISFCIADAATLPFPDNTFDLVTISFATRNIDAGRDILLRYFLEFNRILKPGGRFVNLETTQPRSMIVRRLLYLYVRCAVAPIGHLISGSKAAYRYLAHTIPRFYNAEELSDILRQAGFEKVGCSYLPFGICALHTATK